jgi:hypothetical protein
MPPCPIKPCCTPPCVATIALHFGGCLQIISGVSTNPNLPGVSITATQGGVTVATGTSDAGGNFTFTVSSTAVVTVNWSVTRSPGGSFTVTPVCGSTVNGGTSCYGQSAAGSAFVCLESGLTARFSPSNCPYPVASTLHLTTPNGNTIALTYHFNGGGLSGAGGVWSGSETLHGVNVSTPIIGFPSVPCVSGSTGTVTVGWHIWDWALNDADGPACLSATYGACANGIPCDDGADHCPGGSLWVGAASGVTCGTPGGFSATGTITASFFAGTWTLSE